MRRLIVIAVSISAVLAMPNPVLAEQAGTSGANPPSAGIAGAPEKAPKVAKRRHAKPAKSGTDDRPASNDAPAGSAAAAVQAVKTDPGGKNINTVLPP